MKAIAISVSPSTQDTEKIISVLKEIAAENPQPVILIHGFAPRSILIEKNISPEFLDALKKLFPIQLNMYYNGPLRKEMAVVALQLNAKVYVIGEHTKNVKEEITLYDTAGRQVISLPLPGGNAKASVN